MIEKAHVTLKLTTSEWALVSGALLFMEEHHQQNISNQEITAAERQMHRNKTGQYADLISKLR